MIIFTGEVLPKVSNYDKAGCFIIIIFGGEVVSKIYNQDKIVSFMTIFKGEVVFKGFEFLWGRVFHYNHLHRRRSVKSLELWLMCTVTSPLYWPQKTNPE